MACRRPQGPAPTVQPAMGDPNLAIEPPPARPPDPEPGAVPSADAGSDPGISSGSLCWFSLRRIKAHFQQDVDDRKQSPAKDADHYADPHRFVTLILETSEP